MLEFALKKERIKVSQMKGGEGGNIPAPPELDGNESPSDDIPVSFEAYFCLKRVSVRNGRQPRRPR